LFSSFSFLTLRAKLVNKLPLPIFLQINKFYHFKIVNYDWATKKE
jgi:hypothetical protein